MLASVNKSAASVTPSDKPGPSISGSKISLNTSSTATSIKKAGKGLKSRVSELFSGRRRNTVHANAENKVYATIAEDQDDTIHDNDLEHSSTLANNKRASVLITTFRNSGMNVRADSTDNLRDEKEGLFMSEKGSSCGENETIHSGKDSIRGEGNHGGNNKFMGEMSDKEHSSRDQSRRACYERGMNRAAETAGRQGIVWARPNTLPRVNRDDEDSPTPPPTRDGLAGHYAESETGENRATEDRAAENLAERMTEAEYDRYLEDQLNIAEAGLNEAIAAANRDRVDPEAQARVTDVLRALGRSIHSSRRVLMMNVELRAATVNLIEFNTTRSEIARRAVLDAVENAERIVRSPRV